LAFPQPRKVTFAHRISRSSTTFEYRDLVFVRVSLVHLVVVQVSLVISRTVFSTTAFEHLFDTAFGVDGDPGPSDNFELDRFGISIRRRLDLDLELSELSESISHRQLLDRADRHFSQIIVECQQGLELVSTLLDSQSSCSTTCAMAENVGLAQTPPPAAPLSVTLGEALRGRHESPSKKGRLGGEDVSMYALPGGTSSGATASSASVVSAVGVAGNVAHVRPAPPGLPDPGLPGVVPGSGGAGPGRGAATAADLDNFMSRMMSQQESGMSRFFGMFEGRLTQLEGQIGTKFEAQASLISDLSSRVEAL
jgi:hypothetical protein